MSARQRLQPRSRTQTKPTPGPSSSTNNIDSGKIRRRATPGTSTSNHQHGARYERPAHFPLDPKEKRVLDGIAASYKSENSQTKRYIADALRALGDAAGDLAELVPAVEFTAKGKEIDEDDEDEGEEGVEEEAKRKGKRMLIKMEEKARDMVDLAWEAEMAGGVIRGGVVALAEKVQEEQEEEEEDEKEEGEEHGLWDVYEEDMANLKVQRARQSMKDKYAGVSEYKEFRRSIWETQHQGEPMPPTKHWFPHDPTLQPPAGPASTFPPTQQRQTTDSDSDSDLEIESAKQSYNCPITLRPFTHPVTSTICPHSFERGPIEQMLTQSLSYRDLGSNDKPPREHQVHHPMLSSISIANKVGRGEIERCIHCPAAGCDKWLSGRHLREDRVLLRRIRIEKENKEKEEVLKGIQQDTASAAAAAEGKGGNEAGDESLVMGESAAVGGRGNSRHEKTGMKRERVGRFGQGGGQEEEEDEDA